MVRFSGTNVRPRDGEKIPTHVQVMFEKMNQHAEAPKDFGVKMG